MKIFFVYLFFNLLLTQVSVGQTDIVHLQESSSGVTLIVEGKPFMINGMNWDYFPIGTNYSYELWKQNDQFIKEVLENEMCLLMNIGVNAIRQYTGIPARWIQYIYENYGIYTMLNHPLGRYGIELDGKTIDPVDYKDKKTQDYLLRELEILAMDYKDTPGLLIYLLGNENNYGLFWKGSETQNIPTSPEEQKENASAMYQLFNEASKVIHEIDHKHPVAICNGDIQFLDLISKYCPDVDILGCNIYRGRSFGDCFDRVKREYGKALMFTEFGADAYNAKTNSEDELSQAYYLKENWKEVYANAAGMGKASNCIGGFTFQFSDGWWKHGQTLNLYKHDTHASWANGGYENDYVLGKNNMNEEWFGVCAKEPNKLNRPYELKPREAYYTLMEIHRYHVYEETADLESLNTHFRNIEISKKD